MAIEEELVAGESPDKSVDEGAPGAAMSSAERDPRLSVFRPREPESATPAAPSGEKRDPLRDAVAAWVATTEDEGEGGAGTEDGAEAESSGRVESVADPATADADAAEAEAEAEAEVEADASPEPTAHDSERTAVFRAVRPGSATGASASATAKPATGERTPAADSASASADVPAAGSGDAGKPSATARPDADSASGANKPAAADGSAGKPGSAPAGKDVDSASVSGADRPTAGKAPAHDSERTAVFRAVRPDAAPARGASDSAAAGSGSGPAPSPSKPVSAPAADASADDSERTAVFRAVKPGSGAGASAPAAGKPADGERSSATGSGSGDAKAAAAGGSGGAKPADAKAPDAKPADAKPADAKPADAKPADAKDPEGGDSERTAVFRAPKVDAGAGGAGKRSDGKRSDGKRSDEAADSERTAVFRAVKPEARTSAPAAEKPAASRPVPPKAVGGERASTFVPLRKDDAPAPAKPAAAAAGSAPAAPAAPAPAPAPVPERTERTTQQPLPPKPPLDMLADLTNNPPPPPSPMRTAVRRFKIYAPLVALLAIVLAVVQLVRPLPEPKLTMTAKSSYTFDGGNPVLPWPKEGQAYMAAAGLGTVGSFGEQKPVAIGSVAKTMTAYVILKNHPLKKGDKGPMIDIDQTAVDDGAKSSEGESTVGTLKAGDKISEYDALAAIMIPSANNVARLLARWDSGGDQEAFVKKMNEAAKELGMANTTYTDPSGLDATTVSTAEDQVKLGLKVVEMPELIAITKLPEWTDQYGKKWRNYNTLIPGNGALGIKTGSTTKAGGNLLFAAEKQVGKTRQLIVGAVLGQYGVPILDTAIAASKQVMLATQKMLVNAPVVKKGDVVGYVDDGLGGHTPVVATADVEAVGWPSLTVNVKLGTGDGKLPQTAKAGTEIGVLTVGEGASQVKVPVALQSDLAAPGIGSKLTRVG
ncbi:hypothetical protein [Streptomyces sp. NPDC001903]|uniref:D-alanyl-D-alanine carboxypeptidase n=1 Tax=Streptomyces sp. NPDC001903 TaxID=3364622 RepID=UPI0036C9C81F